MSSYRFKWFRAGRMTQVDFTCGADIENLPNLDRKHWLAISMPVNGVRFDQRMLQLLDADGDGRIRTPEVIAAVEFMRSHNVNFDELFHPTEEDEKKLADVLRRQQDLANEKPGKDELAALAAWEKKGGTPEIAVCGDDTAAASEALAAVESVIDNHFTPPADMPLVIENDDVTLPLDNHINPQHIDKILAFKNKCVKPLIGDCDRIGRADWKRIKNSFAPYRTWLAAKPIMCANAKQALEDEERLLRYKLHFLEFLENFVNMKRLYRTGNAIFQTGKLQIDAKDMNLCLPVADEASHAALSGKSKCCILYLKLTRPSEGTSRNICAVVTAGAVSNLYVGRNGVFYDRDGKDWEAVVTKIVEAQVSLVEAFWMPWRKLGEGIADLVKKFLGDTQANAQGKLQKGITAPAAPAGSGNGGGAAMASGVAAVGIGIGMIGTAAAALAASVKGMSMTQALVSALIVILVVSMPSVILTWFKLRARDIGSILNASGWAVNRTMRFSMKRACEFTRCAPFAPWVGWAIVIILWGIAIFLGFKAFWR